MELTGLLRGVRLTVSGQLAGNGLLTLSGNGVVPASGLPVILDSWQSTVSGNTMSGSFEFSIRSQNPGITAQFSSTLVNVSRTG